MVRTFKETLNDGEKRWKSGKGCEIEKAKEILRVAGN